MKVSPETKKTMIEAIRDEIGDLFDKNWDGILECVAELEGYAITIPAAIKLDFGNKPMTTKTTIVYSVKTKDSLEDQIDDPNQEIMKPIDEEAKKVGRPKREKIKKA